MYVVSRVSMYRNIGILICIISNFWIYRTIDRLICNWYISCREFRYTETSRFWYIPISCRIFRYIETPNSWYIYGIDSLDISECQTFDISHQTCFFPPPPGVASPRVLYGSHGMKGLKTSRSYESNIEIVSIPFFFFSSRLTINHHRRLEGDGCSADAHYGRNM